MKISRKLIVGVAAAAAVVAGGTAAFAAPQAANQGVIVTCVDGDPNNASGSNDPSGVFVVNDATTNPCPRDKTPVRSQGLNTGGPVNGYQIVAVDGVNQNVPDDAASSNTVANCGGTRSATGGGADVNGSANGVLRESFPTDSDTWTAQFAAPGGAANSTEVDAYVICVNATN